MAPCPSTDFAPSPPWRPPWVCWPWARVRLGRLEPTSPAVQYRDRSGVLSGARASLMTTCGRLRPRDFPVRRRAPGGRRGRPRGRCLGSAKGSKRRPRCVGCHRPTRARTRKARPSVGLACARPGACVSGVFVPSAARDESSAQGARLGVGRKGVERGAYENPVAARPQVPDVAVAAAVLRTRRQIR